VGVRSRSTRKKLLSEDRTFDQAVKVVAQAVELAEKESKELLLSAERTETTQAHSISNKKKYSKAGMQTRQNLLSKGKLVSDVDLHNIWQASAAIPIQHVTIVKRRDT
jgi:hypothetical protein